MTVAAIIVATATNIGASFNHFRQYRNPPFALPHQQHQPRNAPKNLSKIKFGRKWIKRLSNSKKLVTFAPHFR